MDRWLNLLRICLVYFIFWEKHTLKFIYFSLLCIGSQESHCCRHSALICVIMAVTSSAWFFSHLPPQLSLYISAALPLVPAIILLFIVKWNWKLGLRGGTSFYRIQLQYTYPALNHIVNLKRSTTSVIKPQSSQKLFLITSLFFMIVVLPSLSLSLSQFLSLPVSYPYIRQSKERWKL